MLFHELADGEKFHMTIEEIKGNPVVYQKTLEDGAYHNAVVFDDSSKCIRVSQNAEVRRICNGKHHWYWRFAFAGYCRRCGISTPKGLTQYN